MAITRPIRRTRARATAGSTRSSGTSSISSEPRPAPRTSAALLRFAADDRAAVDEGEIGVGAEVRLRGVTLGLEHVEGIDLTRREAERIEHHGRSLCHVHAAQIDDELVVDEDPDVVVSGEAEGFPALVLE